MPVKYFFKVSLPAGGILFSLFLNAQELFVFSEPASNMLARSISAKLMGKLALPGAGEKPMQRYTPEVMFGLNKNWMVHGAVSFSDMYSSNLKWESARIYAKYRFLSVDEVHRHFRMAAFVQGAVSDNRLMYDELSLEGDHSGLQGGVIITQLLNKLAISTTIGYLHASSRKPVMDPRDYPGQAATYSLSAGYLVLPAVYRDFRQTNLNVYAELLGQRALDRQGYYLDLAPAAQLIFNSNTKLNLGYRFQLAGNMLRMAPKGWVLSLETSFLNALQRRR